MQELFSKLRFSYIEQVTKEKFLRAIVGEPPQIVEHQENVELEQRLVAAKAELKAQKLAVGQMVAELESRGRQLSESEQSTPFTPRRSLNSGAGYEQVEAQKSQLATLPAKNESLKETIAALRAQQPANAGNPALNLPLHATQDVLASRQAELEGLEKRLRGLQQVLPRKSRELELLETELRPLELQRAGTIAAAQEARQRREEGERGRGDDLELKGRWYRNVDVALRDILQVEA